jgi:hypothetical protein
MNAMDFYEIEAVVTLVAAARLALPLASFAPLKYRITAGCQSAGESAE